MIRSAARRLDLMLLGLLALATIVVPPGLSAGVAGLGVVEGAFYALLALGLILVYRSDRIINFAVVQVGFTAAVLFAELVTRLQFLRWASVICPPCLPGGLAAVPGWLVQVNFWLSALTALAVATGLSGLAYLLLVRRFRRAPKLVMTVVTIALAQLLASVAAFIPSLFIVRRPGQQVEGSDQFNGVVGVPYDLTIHIRPAVFHAADVAAVVLAVVAAAALVLVLRFTRLGVSIRGAAENEQRAQTLGINVGAVSTTVWFAAGLLSGVAGLLAAVSKGVFTTSPLAFGTTTRVMVVALIARFVSLPVAVVGAVVLGLLNQSMFAALKSSTPFEVALVVVIAVFLVVQAGRRSRAEAEAQESWLAAREARPVPRQLDALPAVRGYRRIGGTILLLGVTGLPFVLSPSQVNVASVVVVYAIVGLSLLVLTGWAGQISLGQFAFAGVGAAAAAYLNAVLLVPFPICVLGGGVAGAVVAAFVGVPALRLSGLNLAITTLALALAVSDVVLNRAYLGANLPASLDRPLFFGLDFGDDRVFFLFNAAVLALTVGAVTAMRRSRTGRVLIACRDNEPAAQSLGVNLFRARLSAFAISGFMAASAGGLLVFIQRGVQAPSYAPEVSIGLFLMVVIGGMGSVSGPLLGALYVGVLLAQPSPALSFLGTGAGVLVILLVAPGGFSQLLFALRDSYLRRVALRHRISAPSLLGAGGGADGPAPLQPKTRPGGGTAFIPRRYALEDPEP
ncbi:MAG: ABC transporter permease subunit [Candidatus Dormibacteria bacterium]